MGEMSVSKPGSKKVDPSQSRRRLSLAASADTKLYKLDGGGAKTDADDNGTEGASEASGKVVKHASLSKVGYVPYNNSKVNQDRASVQIPFAGDESKSFWGVFDGHGSLGHEVSSYVQANLHKCVKNHLKSTPEVAKAMHMAFVECNKKVCNSPTDCTFSGTTVIVVYIDGDQLYSANAGDSRACLAKVDADGKFTAVELSDDQKPEREDEAKRIVAKGGRVQACKGSRGEDIGPQRVWLKKQDLPGLAMTRSFGDLCAASVGVIPEPEVWQRTIEDDDAFIILASDGVWEFITNQEAVDIVAKAKTPQLAVKKLTDEATLRWQQEEEVIDDITAVVAYFK